MLKEFGGMFGWVLIIAIAGTMLNFVLKLVNKHFGKKLSASPAGKKMMKVLMTVFVRNHKYFGIASMLLLSAHFIAQFTTFGLNLTGGLAALLLIFQVALGLYGVAKKKPRRGAWFVVHRFLAVLFVFGIALHLVAPYALNAVLNKGASESISDSAPASASSTTNASDTSDTSSASDLQTFTPDELAKYDGKDGNKAYVAYNGLIYDITNHPKWSNGKHNGNTAGTDLTAAIKRSPHGASKFESLEIVGKLA